MTRTGTQGKCAGLPTLAAVGIAAGLFTGSPAIAADPPSEQQIQKLLESAAQATDRPDHDFAGNSIRSVLDQAKPLQLTQEQTEKIKAIQQRYAETKSKREAAYQQSEMDALKLIHDRHSSLSAVEAAVQRADQEHSKLRMAGIAALREATDVLRPEQYAQWRQTHAAGQVAQSGRPDDSGPQPEPERMAPH
ncbi:Spy/CpxP family protein refolding chaperone [Nitrospira moscoviensis]|uniref:Periplasmic heavy metal sensor n=1 Tax=Nitrospira moscoviensis TaxID=42253 RepID=A0A0K2GE35_NITMO|nr:hypothetical protein [Nitrospira moscoviensis]ALA59216.1 exported protein of unknown function [Nitrospira moscoviensis]